VNGGIVTLSVVEVSGDTVTLSVVEVGGDTVTLSVVEVGGDTVTLSVVEVRPGLRLRSDWQHLRNQTDNISTLWL